MSKKVTLYLRDIAILVVLWFAIRMVIGQSFGTKLLRYPTTISEYIPIVLALIVFAYRRFLRSEKVVRHD